MIDEGYSVQLGMCKHQTGPVEASSKRVPLVAALTGYGAHRLTFVGG